MQGHDIGTRWYKASVLDEAGKPVSVMNTRGDDATPTCVHFSQTGATLVGEAAIEQGYLDPMNFAENTKSMLGTLDNVLKGSLHKTATDVAEVLIKAAQKDMERQVGARIKEVAVSYPAYFQDGAKQALIEAFHRAGLEVILLVAEPVAAGYAYAIDKASSSGIVLVFDFGGGSLDVSLLEYGGSDIRVLATTGDGHLGGNDLTEPIRQRLLDAIEAQCGHRPTMTDNPLVLFDIDRRAEQAKISLGARPEILIPIGYEGHHQVVTMTQQEYHEAIRPQLDRALAVIDQALAMAGIGKDQVGQLLLVGGSTRMPLIQSSVADYMGRAPRTDVDPGKAVAYGTALAGAAEMARRGKPFMPHGRAIPTPRMLLRDITIHNVGVTVVDRTSPDKRLINSVLIPAGTQIPHRRTERFFLEYPEQTEARVEILQGEPNADRDQCEIIGVITLDGLTPEPTRTRRILINIEIDRNAMVTATGTDEVSGRSDTISIDYTKGIQTKAGHKLSA